MTDRITVSQTVTAHLGEVPGLLDTICGWLVANGLDPVRVSGRHDIVVIGDRIQYHEVVTDEDGAQVIDYTDVSRTVGTCFRVVPLVTPMPDEWPTLPIA
jgi:hypothetical protein